MPLAYIIQNLQGGQSARCISMGGDVANAAISCKDGSCTITDGTITETCTDCLTNCANGACDPK